MSLASSRFTMARGDAFTQRVQVLGVKQAQAITSSGSPFDQVSFAQRFLADPGLYAGKLALGLVDDPAITDTWNGIAGTGADSTATDDQILSAIGYAFAKYRNVL